jgi:hypothetical protein
LAQLRRIDAGESDFIAVSQNYRVAVGYTRYGSGGLGEGGESDRQQKEGD